jgi:hypothetical protein
MTIKATGRMNVPHPATFEMELIHQPVTWLRCVDNRLRMVRNPTKAMTMPRMSNLRSLEIFLQLIPDLDRLWLVRLVVGNFVDLELLLPRDEFEDVLVLLGADLFLVWLKLFFANSFLQITERLF